MHLVGYLYEEPDVHYRSYGRVMVKPRTCDRHVTRVFTFEFIELCGLFFTSVPVRVSVYQQLLAGHGFLKRACVPIYIYLLSHFAAHISTITPPLQVFLCSLASLFTHSIPR